MSATVLSVTHHIWLFYVYDAQESVLEVLTEDPQRDSHNLPDECASFGYYCTLEAVLDLDGIKVHVENTNTAINESKLFWVDGTLITPNKVISAGGEDFLHLDSRPTDWLDMYGDEKSIVKDRLGNYHYYEEARHELMPTL